MKKIFSMLVVGFLLMLILFNVAAFGTTINTTQQLKSYLENSLKTGVVQAKFSSKLSLKQIANTLQLLESNGYEYSYVKGYYYSKTGPYVTVKFTAGYSQAAIKKMNADVDKEVQRIVKLVIKAEMTAYQKELALHNYLVNNARYDTRVYTGKAPDVSYTAYGALVKKTAVCEGYAKALSLLFKKAGIPTVYVIGTGLGQPHAWNMVKLDGEYYHVDATFDDPVNSSGAQVLSHEFFNLTDSRMQVNHKWSSKLPKATATKYAYRYDTEMADASLLKTAQDMAGALEKAVLEKKTTMTVRVFKFQSEVIDISAILEDVMAGHGELTYSVFFSGYRSTTVGDITTLDIMLNYMDNN